LRAHISTGKVDGAGGSFFASSQDNNTPNLTDQLIIALEGLAAVVNRVTCSAPVPGSTLYVHACHPRGALPAPGLAGCSVGHGE